MSGKGISGSSLSALLLYQAEERTKLVVDCAGLLRRLEALDSEIAEYDQWQRYPTHRYKSNVQIRYEEARRREANEALRRGDGEWMTMASLADMPLVPRAPQAPAPSQRNPRPQTASTTKGLGKEDEEEGFVAVKILQRGLRAAEFEAEVWRHRAHDAALASDREREQARHLMEFEISAALQDAEEERKRSALLLRDRDAAFEKIEQEFKAVKSDLELQRSHAANLKKELQDVRVHCDHEVLQARCQRDNAIRTSEVQRTELCRANRAAVAALEAELAVSKRDAQGVVAEKEKQRKFAAQLETQVSALEAELAVSKRDAQGVVAEKEKQRKFAAQLETQVSQLRSECEVHRKECEGKVEALTGAQIRVEMLGAKCENLQVALDNATRRQAELAIERDTLKDQTNNLVGVQQRIDFEVDALRDSVEKIVKVGEKQHGSKSIIEDLLGASTTSTAVGSGVSSRVSSPRGSVASVSPQLPPVRPSSALQKSPNWRRELLNPVGLPVP